MNLDEIISKLRQTKRGEVAKATGLTYGYLSKVIYGEIQNPGAIQIDKLRAYFARSEARK